MFPSNTCTQSAELASLLSTKQPKATKYQLQQYMHIGMTENIVHRHTPVSKERNNFFFFLFFFCFLTFVNSTISWKLAFQNENVVFEFQYKTVHIILNFTYIEHISTSVTF